MFCRLFSSANSFLLLFSFPLLSSSSSISQSLRERFLSLLSSILKKRLVYHTRALAYVRIQAVGMTNCRIKKGVTNCRIKKMVEHTDNQKKRENAENKTAFDYIRYRRANVSRISALTFCLEIDIASKSPVQRFFQFFL